MLGGSQGWMDGLTHYSDLVKATKVRQSRIIFLKDFEVNNIKTNRIGAYKKR
jgi:hypothetical protein